MNPIEHGLNDYTCASGSRIKKRLSRTFGDSLYLFLIHCKHMYENMVNHRGSGQGLCNRASTPYHCRWPVYSIAFPGLATVINNGSRYSLITKSLFTNTSSPTAASAAKKILLEPAIDIASAGENSEDKTLL